MKRFVLAVLCLATSCLIQPSAQAQNPEDQAIPDENVPAQPAGPAAAVPQPAPARPSTPTAPGTGDTVTIPRAELDALKARQDELQRQLNELKKLLPATSTDPAPTATAAPSGLPSTAAPAEEMPADTSQPSSTAPSGGRGNRALLLPDISFEAQAKAKASTDRRDPDRNVLRLTEGELGIQSYVYPNVKADAFITAAPDQNGPFQVEEGYLTFLGLARGLNLKLGRQHTAFGRTGLQHSHSWPYARQVSPIANLVDPEALSGDGVNLTYILPTRGNLFAQADLGIYQGVTGPGTISTQPLITNLLQGPGAGFGRAFQTGRLLLSHPAGDTGSVELGGSYARGVSTLQDDANNQLATGRLALSGVDLTYRRYGEGNKRFLLRSEYFRYRPRGALMPTVGSANGYYILGNIRKNAFSDIGLLYERSAFPQAPGLHETGLSLIYTKQFTEQFYMRLQGTHGSRPGKSNFNDMLLQFTWGVGPHTHNLE